MIEMEKPWTFCRLKGLALFDTSFRTLLTGIRLQQRFPRSEPQNFFLYFLFCFWTAELIKEARQHLLGDDSAVSQDKKRFTSVPFLVIYRDS